MSEKTSSVPQLCLQCKAFYGSVANDNLCSMCFNKSKKEARKQQADSGDEAIKEKQQSSLSSLPVRILKCLKTQSIEVQCSGKLQEQQNEKKKPSEVKKTIYKCSTCSKKVGMLGYDCKHCSSTFCKVHRLPEDHDCQVDFISLGRKKLKVQNPVIEKPKIERI